MTRWWTRRDVSRVIGNVALRGALVHVFSQDVGQFHLGTELNGACGRLPEQRDPCSADIKYDFQKSSSSSSSSFSVALPSLACVKRPRCRLVGHILVTDDASAG